MNRFSNLSREIIFLLIAAGIGVLFGILVAYPEMLAMPRENSARITSNEKRIESLWEAHQISHEPKHTEEEKER